MCIIRVKYLLFLSNIIFGIVKIIVYTCALSDLSVGVAVLRVWVDKRITIGQLKEEMQRWVGVSQDHFKLFKIYSKR